MTFQVQKRMCPTCIYRPDSLLDIKKLEAAVADPRMSGHFRAYRECHHAKRGSGVCCRGFWEAHKDHFDAGQLAQRLDLVEFVEVDVLAEPIRKPLRLSRKREIRGSANKRASSPARSKARS